MPIHVDDKVLVAKLKAQDAKMKTISDYSGHLPSRTVLKTKDTVQHAKEVEQKRISGQSRFRPEIHPDHKLRDAGAVIEHKSMAGPWCMRNSKVMQPGRVDAHQENSNFHEAIQRRFVDPLHPTNNAYHQQLDPSSRRPEIEMTLRYDDGTDKENGALLTQRKSGRKYFPDKISKTQDEEYLESLNKPKKRCGGRMTFQGFSGLDAGQMAKALALNHEPRYTRESVMQNLLKWEEETQMPPGKNLGRRERQEQARRRLGGHAPRGGRAEDEEEAAKRPNPVRLLTRLRADSAKPRAWR